MCELSQEQHVDCLLYLLAGVLRLFEGAHVLVGALDSSRFV